MQILDTTPTTRPRHGFLLVEPSGALTPVAARPVRHRAIDLLAVMRAETFDPARVTYPTIAQPKLDGVRATLSGDGLFTRDRLPIRSLPHVAALAAFLPDGVVVDGELWGEGLTLEEISATVRAAGPTPTSPRLALHAFDLFLSAPVTEFDGVEIEAGAVFAERHGWLTGLLRGLGLGRAAPVRPIETVLSTNPGHLAALYERWLDSGLEGQIVRDPEAPYAHGRSHALMRRKPFLDAEGVLVAIVAGRKTGLPRVAIVRDLETGEKLPVAIQAMSDAARRALAAAPPEAGRLVTYRWQASASTHHRHRTLVRIHGPEGRF